MVSSKFLDFGGAAGGTSWIEYKLLADCPAAVVAMYDLISANDCPERDPCKWVLEGVTEADTNGALKVLAGDRVERLGPW
jgi:peptide-N4-(N-acetyl-beta-glucosaminyl)asparagine amidase